MSPLPMLHPNRETFGMVLGTPSRAEPQPSAYRRSRGQRSKENPDLELPVVRRDSCSQTPTWPPTCARDADAGAAVKTIGGFSSLSKPAGATVSLAQ